ncbi:ArnT family glycosyltransferase [Mucilaginibacter myungsuensis]|uniref:Glycosyltransferase family 39 protein n=1 Tax=Mucilaginibacter myungsuensis TaxID=649104 RepID=A0A929KTW4_9SPHI|nr:glycosyltransferase family 39 protein [Mucilaginibacter myungsuensis]MBE9661464.1 glycosyltransferase family 39 protein [Mucilaginibacter myungsuensis]MDN3597607.1 glycosyltransferase family 39 protein [Mucilaginibacter myungsuensis]
MDRPQNDTYYKWLYILIGMAVLVNFSGLFVTIIGPDGTFYATIAKTMVQKHDYVNLYVKGADFLDKPHFPFWVTAAFFEVFGFVTWAYKLPGILFLMMGAVYTYRFAKDLYNKEIALWSVLILLTAEHIIISNNDVRAEPYLTGLIIAAIYHLYLAHTRNNYWHILWGSIFAALAIMTKGMFAIIPIGGAIVAQFIFTKQWRAPFHLRWLLAIVLTLIFILPEVYCVYAQFDLHPEKLVFDKHNVSGVKFFFWDSQFGRFFNTGPIKGSGDPFFFVHTLAWAFLPWSLLLFAAIYQSIKQQVKNTANAQWYCLGGALLTFLVFSASKFQLPYYLNIIFPLFAIQLAAYLYTLQNSKSKYWVQNVQSVVMLLMLIVVAALQYYFRPEALAWPVVVIMGLLMVLAMSIPKHTRVGEIRKVAIRTTIVAFVVNLYFNLAFYPTLLKYQGGSEAADYINSINTNNYPVAQTGDVYSFPLDFYIRGTLKTIDPVGNGPLPQKPFYLVSNARVLGDLVKLKGWQMEEVKSFDTYWISMLKTAFLNRTTRQAELETIVVVLVK